MRMPFEAMCGFRGDGLGSIAPQLDAKRNGYMCIFLMGKLEGFRLGSERSRTRRYIDFTTVAFVRWYNRWARTHPFEGW